MIEDLTLAKYSLLMKFMNLIIIKLVTFDKRL